MQPAETIIAKGVAAGRPLSDIQAELRRGYDGKEITGDLAIQALSLVIEETVRLSVNLFNEALKLMGAEVNVEGMANAHIQSLRLSQDAFFYDVLNDVTYDGEVVIEGQTTLDEQIEEADTSEDG